MCCAERGQPPLHSEKGLKDTALLAYGCAVHTLASGIGGCFIQSKRLIPFRADISDRDNQLAPTPATWVTEAKRVGLSGDLSVLSDAYPYVFTACAMAGAAC